MIVILMGAPGSGKGTQCKILAQKYGFTHLATGDIFRAEIAANTSIGQKAAEYVRTGKLVPDAIVSEMVAAKLEPTPGSREQFLLDGFPRNVEQAQSLDTILSKQGRSISSVVFLNLSHQEALRRLSSRRICAGCGHVYNLVSMSPKVEGKCDLCGKDLIQREDDSEATVNKRLMVFEDLTRPVIAYYKAEQVFHEVDAARAQEQVTSSLCSVVEEAAARR